jgi:hypothetical protein
MKSPMFGSSSIRSSDCREGSLIHPGGGAGVLKLDPLAQRVPLAVRQYGLALMSVAMSLGVTSSLELHDTLNSNLFTSR